MEYSKNTHVTMVDLDKQIALAQNNSALFPAYSERIQFFPTHITKDFANLPSNVDTVWMSQFLDCFSLEEIQIIMKRIQKSVAKSTSIFVLEPLWDKQDYPAATYSLQATSLYFTALANGKSKMYPYKTLKDNIEACGFVLKNEYHRLGEHDYSLMEFKAL